MHQLGYSFLSNELAQHSYPEAISDWAERVAHRVDALELLWDDRDQ